MCGENIKFKGTFCGAAEKAVKSKVMDNVINTAIAVKLVGLL